MRHARQTGPLGLGEMVTRRPQDERLPRHVRIGLWLGALFVLLFVISRFTPQLVEQIYARTIYPPLVSVLSVVTSWVPFSLSEWAFGVVALVLLTAPFRGYLRARRVGRSTFGAMKTAAWQTLGEMGWVWSIFLLLWGFNYARVRPAPLFSLMQPVHGAERVALTHRIGERIDRLRMALPEDENGVVVFDHDFAELDHEIRILQTEALSAAGMPTIDVGRTKTFAASPLMLRWGISGAYGPFTGETNLVWPAPPTQAPFVIAHERAHLSGFAWEEAASFVGLLTLWRSEDPKLRYSAWIQLWLEMRRGIDGRHPGVVRDLRAYSDFVRSHRGAEAPAVREVYSTYLKAHGVKGGSRSYGRVASLALRYLDRHGLPPIPASLFDGDPPSLDEVGIPRP